MRYATQARAGKSIQLEKKGATVFKARRKGQFGQGMVEYIIIVSLIALAAIAAFSYFGKAVRGQSAQMAAQIAGQDNNTGIAEAKKAADNSAANEAKANVSLGDYDKRDHTQ